MPYYGDRNPYLALLARALESAGANVTLERGGSLRALRRRVEAGCGPDVLHLQWHHRFFVPRSAGWVRTVRRTARFFHDCLALRRAGVSLVWTVHNIFNHEGRRLRWERAACRLLARLVDRLIVHCPSAVPLVAAAYGIGPDRIEVAPHGHYGEWYPPPLSRERARSQLGLPLTARILLFFGQIREYKGLEALLADFAAVEDPNLRLVVLGEPRDRALAAALEEGAARDPRVTLHLAFVPEDQLVIYVSACDAVILPYTESLTSGAAVLAAGHERPVIAPRLGCMQEFSETGGLLYDPEEPGALVRVLRAAGSAPLDQMGAVARDWAQGHPWSATAERLIAIYRALGTRKRSRDGVVADYHMTKPAGP